MSEAVTSLYKKLQPLIAKDIQQALRGGRPQGGASGGGGGFVTHELASTTGLGVYHTVTGLTTGFVLKATGATTAIFGALNHSELANIGVNDHHAQAHVLATNAGLGADHTISGATAGHVLRATSATAAAFAQLQYSDIGGSPPGGPMSGPEWEYLGNMIIDANAATDTTVTIANEGAGTVNLIVGNNITAGGTIFSAELENAGNVTIDANSASDTTITLTNAGAGTVDLVVGRHITLGGLINGVDVAALAAGSVATSLTLTAGAGLTGGGDLSANRTFTVGAGDGITVNADDVAVDSTVVRTSRTLTAGAGLTGGGTLAADRTFTVGAGTLITVNADDVALSNGSAQYQVPVTGGTPFGASWTNLASFAGDGLVFTTNNVFDIVVGNGLTVSANAIALTAPGTLSATSPNDNSGNHTHAITTSANPGTNVRILASTSAGGLTLQSLEVQGSVDITNSGNFTVGANVLFVNNAGTRVGINTAPDPQFDLDVLGNIRTQGYFVGKHAMTVKDAILVAHYDGPSPYETNPYGEPNGHMGQSATVDNVPVYRYGKFLKAIEIADATTNLLSNPSVETDLTGWTAFASGTGAGTVTRITTQFRFGLAAIRINKTAGADGDNYGAFHDFSVTSGQSYTLSAWVKAQTLTGGTQTVTISAGQALNVATTSINGESDEWQRISVTTTAASTGSGRLSVYIDNATTGAIIIDGIQAENVAYATPYTDGVRSACNIHYNDIGIDWDDFTAMLWARPAALPSVMTSRYLLDVYVDATNRYIITIDSTGDKVRATNLNGPTTLISSTSVVAQTWIHVALVVDGTTATLYINGVAEDSDTFAAVAGTPDIYVGSENDNTDRVNGLIDDLVIVRRSLPASEVLAVYQSDAPVFAETSVFQFRATPQGLVWADEFGLWMRAADGTACFAVSGTNGNSWGGIALDLGDVMIGNANGGEDYIHWNKSNGTIIFVGDGGGITSISGSNITTGTIDASVVNVTNINATNISTGSLSAARIAAGTITSSHIAANTIVAGDIAAGTITANEIAAFTIVANNIASNTITANKIAANTITAANIAAGTITGTEIAAGSIVATHIGVSTLAALIVNTGAISISGVASVGASGGIFQGSGTFASPTTGLKIWNDGGFGRIASYAGGVVGWDVTAGTVTAGFGTFSFTGQEMLMTDNTLVRLRWDLGADTIDLTGLAGATPELRTELPADGLFRVQYGANSRMILSDTLANFASVDVSASTIISNSYYESTKTNLAFSFTAAGTTLFISPLAYDKSDLTIASGVITVTKNYHRVDTEAAGATDDLVTINGGISGQILVLGTVASTRDVVLKHGTGNILLNGGIDFSLLFTRYRCVLMYDGSSWAEIGRGA